MKKTVDEYPFQAEEKVNVSETKSFISKSNAFKQSTTDVEKETNVD